MLHSDTLAQEFNEILNAVEIFAPFQPLDPRVSLYAPLRNTTRDLRLNQDVFSRNSDAWYKDGSGIYRHVGINQPRFEENQLLIEPARTNKQTTYNANPDAAAQDFITNLDPGATFGRVQDPSALITAGLSDICSSGFVWRLDNRAASGDSYAQMQGFTNNTNDHVMSVFWRGTGQGYLRLQGVAGTPKDLPAAYEREVLKQTPPDSSQRMRIYAEPGADLYFILQQFEDSPVVTSPIVTEGTAGQRAIERLEYEGLFGFFNQGMGVCSALVTPLWDKADIGQVLNPEICSVRAGPGLLYSQQTVAGDGLRFYSFDGANSAVVLFVGEPTAGESWRAVARWNFTSPNILSVGARKNADWTWDDRAYDGEFVVDGDVLRLAHGVILPLRISDVTLYSSYLTQEEAEEAFS